MKKERIFNLFLEINDGRIFEIGAVAHDMAGTDEGKLKFLQRSVKADLPRAKRYPIASRYLTVDLETGHHAKTLSYESYIALSEAGKHLEFFEEVFEELGAPADPLVCITPIVDGEPRIDVLDRF